MSRDGPPRNIPLSEPWISDMCADLVRDQIATGWLGPAASTRTFEERICSLVNAKYCVLTTSGTMALSVAAKALALEPGDEILIPAYGVVSTINAFAAFGLDPKLVDISISTGSLDPSAVKAAISSKTKAICFVDFSGYLGPDLVEISNIAQVAGIPLIEDAACALCQQYQGNAAGTFGDIGTLSFSVPKVITTGQGGALLTRFRPYYERAQDFIDQGDRTWRETNTIKAVGLNLRFNDVLAALGLAQLEDLEYRLRRKAEVFNILRGTLGSALFTIPTGSPPLHNIVFAEEPDRLISHLRKHGISAVSQYRTLNQHPPFSHLFSGPLHGSNYWSRHAVYLPFGLALERQDAERIAQTIVDSNVPLLSQNINQSQAEAQRAHGQN